MEYKMNEVNITSGRMNHGIDPVLHAWGWEIPLYLFLGGLVAGILFFSALFFLRKKESDFKPDVIRQQLARKMNINFYYANLEWEYKNIKPRILIEPLLSDSSGNTMLNDYKIHCFNGKALFIQTIFDRMNTVKEDWFDRDWQAQPFWYFSSRRREVPRPACLDQMLEIAEALAVDFTYVRVDLYEINGRVYFGEFTFRPYGGFMKWNDKKWDSYLGDLLQLPLDA